jgi:hypothetical protein
MQAIQVSGLPSTDIACLPAKPASEIFMTYIDPSAFPFATTLSLFYRPRGYFSTSKNMFPSLHSFSSVCNKATKLKAICVPHTQTHEHFNDYSDYTQPGLRLYLGSQLTDASRSTLGHLVNTFKAGKNWSEVRLVD